MIQLAMEIPTAYLHEWAPLCDLDFILAHQVLEDEDYAEFFRCRPKGRELIMDNSLHELGHPLSPADLLEAAIRCRADYVITPDYVGDMEFNLRSYEQCRQLLAGFKLAVVMTGSKDSTVEEREEFLVSIRDADMLCLTFKEPRRLPWYRASALAKRWKRVHLLGLDSFEELHEFRVIAGSDYSRRWSLDTAKPVKWGLESQYLDQLQTLRGAPTHSKDLLNIRHHEILLSQCRYVVRNIEILKGYLR